VNEMLLDFYIGDHSLMTDFMLKSSIDQETYNKIKLYRDNQKAGKREVYIAQDSANIAKWGVLQLTQSVDDDKNEAQISALLDQLIILRNRETKSLQIEAIGDVRVRAGCFVPIVISELGINQPFLVDEATHRFSGNDYTISITLKVIG